MKRLYDKIKLLIVGLVVTFGLVAFIFSTELEWFWLAAVGDFILVFGVIWIVASSEKPWIKFAKERYQFLSESVPMMLSGWFRDCCHDWEYGYQKNEVDSMGIVNGNGTFFSGDYLTASKGKNSMYLDDLSGNISFSMSYVEYGDFKHVEHTDDNKKKSDENSFCGCIYDFDFLCTDPYRLDIIGNNFFCVHPAITKMKEKMYSSFRVYAENSDMIEKFMTREKEDAISALFHKYEGRLLISIQNQHLYVAIQDEKDPFEVGYKLHRNIISPDQNSVQIKKEEVKDNIRNIAQFTDDITDVFYSGMGVEVMNPVINDRRIPKEKEFLERLRKEISTNNRRRTAIYFFVFIFIYVGMLGAYLISVNR